MDIDSSSEALPFFMNKMDMDWKPCVVKKMSASCTPHSQYTAQHNRYTAQHNRYTAQHSTLTPIHLGTSYACLN